MDAGLDALKTASKKEVNKSAEATAELLGSKFVDAVTKSKDSKIVKPEHVISRNPQNIEERTILLKKDKKY